MFPDNFYDLADVSFSFGQEEDEESRIETQLFLQNVSEPENPLESFYAVTKINPKDQQNEIQGNFNKWKWEEITHYKEHLSVEAMQELYEKVISGDKSCRKEFLDRYLVYWNSGKSLSFVQSEKLFPEPIKMETLKINELICIPKLFNQSEDICTQSQRLILSYEEKTPHPDLLYTIGTMYFYGTLVETNLEKGLKYIVQAANLGHIFAHVELGIMYFNGKGVEPNKSAAFRHFKIAADRGIAIAQDALGKMYHYGVGVSQSPVNAIKYFTLAAEQGHKGAQGYLKLINPQGTLPVPKPIERARLFNRTGFSHENFQK